MTPYAQGKRWTLWHADCLDVLAALPDGSVEVVTDPPYNAINREASGLRDIDKGGADSAPIDVPTVAAEFWRVSAGSIYVWCSDEQFSEWVRAFVGMGATHRRYLWWKTNPSPMNGEHLWLSATEVCVFARKPGAHFTRRCAHPIWRGPTENAVPGHPTPKPVALMRDQIEASVPLDAIVLDPYAGSGSTGVAALASGRRFYGVETEAAYLPIIARRLAQAESDGVQGTLFGSAA